MHLRACIAAAATVCLVLLAPAVAQAHHPFSVSKSEAAAGDEIEFNIVGTQAGESYIVNVNDHEVASGFDSQGNGVTDKFKMPDFGGENQSVAVQVTITVPGDADHSGYQIVQYVAAFSGGSGDQPAAQPAPAVTVPVPESDSGPGTSTTPARTTRPTVTKPTETRSGNSGNSNNTGNSDNNTSSGSGSPSPSSTSTGSGSVVPTSSPKAPVAAKPQVPGPSGPNAPVATSIASALSPLSGIAEPGKTGFPILLILLIVLLAATALTAAGPRLWQRWEPALPWGPKVDDEVRLTALRRASASGAELQQTIAERRATRASGRGRKLKTATESSKVLQRH